MYLQCKPTATTFGQRIVFVGYITSALKVETMLFISERTALRMMGVKQNKCFITEGVHGLKNESNERRITCS